MADSKKRAEVASPTVQPLPLLNWRLHYIEEGDYHVEVELGVVDGDVVCTSLRVCGYDPDVGVKAAVEKGLFSPVSATVVRKVRVRAAIDGAVSSHRMERMALLHDIASLPETLDEYLEQIGLHELIDPGTKEDAKRRKAVESHLALTRWDFQNRRDALEVLEEADSAKRQGRPPLPDEEIVEASLIYREAVRSGVRFPSKEVQKTMSISSNQARRRIMYARKRGYLPPTEPGKVRA